MAAWWEQFLEGLRGEFPALTDAAWIGRILLRLLVAALLGGLLGFQREETGKSAGIRTHMLVALGAALFVLTGQFAGMDDHDLSRVVQGIVAGIGFLGAGAILKRTESYEVRGLTTAADIWLTCAVGVAVGLGREALAILATVLAILILAFVPHINRWTGGTRGSGQA
jgi:putative Mg2+ transporter-C (MgtC) family protein